MEQDVRRDQRNRCDLSHDRRLPRRTLAKRVCETVETLYVVLELCVCRAYFMDSTIAVIFFLSLFETDLSPHSNYLNRDAFSRFFCLVDSTYRGNTNEKKTETYDTYLCGRRYYFLYFVHQLTFYAN